MIDKKQMTEEDIKLRYITPAITAKWSLDHITMENGKLAIRNLIMLSYPTKKQNRHERI
jgi:type I restriction enzyme R subunit